MQEAQSLKYVGLFSKFTRTRHERFPARPESQNIAENIGTHNKTEAGKNQHAAGTESRDHLDHPFSVGLWENLPVRSATVFVSEPESREESMRIRADMQACNRANPSVPPFGDASNAHIGGATPADVADSGLPDMRVRVTEGLSGGKGEGVTRMQRQTGIYSSPHPPPNLPPIRQKG